MPYGIHAFSAWGHKPRIAYVWTLGSGPRHRRPYAETEWVR
jgi:hypothetical protein